MFLKGTEPKIYHGANNVLTQKIKGKQIRNKETI